MHTMRKSLAVALAVSTLALAPRPAHAITVLGFGAEAEEIIAAIVALQTAVTNLQRAGNDSLEAMRRALDSGQFDLVRDTLQTNRATLQRVYSDLERIGATEAGMNSQWQRAFPQDAAAWRNVQYSDFDNLYTIWNSQLVESSGTAARAQAALADVRDRNSRAAEILRRSELSGGSEVQQLQTQNQMLAVMQADLSSILQSVASQGRVLSQMAAESASEKAMAREATRRRWEHHSDPVPPSPARLTRFPDVASSPR